MATNLHLRQVTNSRYDLNSQFSRYRNLDDREGGREREKGGGGGGGCASVGWGRGTVNHKSLIFANKC